MVDFGIKYKTLFDFAPIGISVVDADRNVIETNKTLETISRLSKEDLKMGVFKTRKYIHSNGREMSAEEFPSSIALRENHAVNGVEIGIRLEDGEIIWTEVSAAPLEGNGKYAMVITQDITDRRNFEQQLSVSEERFRSIFESSIDAILLTGRGGVIYSANPAACKMFRMTESELCIIGREGVVDKEDPRLTEGIKQRDQTGTFMGELTLKRKDGTRFPAELTSSIFIDNTGLELTSMIIRDISERKKIERSLKASEEIWRQLVSTIPDYIALHDVDGRYLFLNHYAEGFSEKDVVGKNLFDFISGESKEVFSINFVRCISTKQPQQFKYSAFGNDKVIRFYEGHLVPILENGNLLHVLSIAKDITERKRAEDELKNALQWHQAIFESSRDSIFITDIDSRFVAVNEAACKLTGYSRNELLNMRIPDLHEPGDLQAYNMYHKKILNGEEILTEAIILRKDGSGIVTEFNNRCVCVRETRYMHTTARDISERKQIEAEMHLRSEIVKNITQGVNLVSMVDGNILYTNRRFDEMFGYEPGELIGKNISIVNAPSEKSPDETKQEIFNILKGIGEWHGEIINRKKNGDTFWTYADVSMFNHHDFGKVLITTQSDITERVLIKKALAESEARFRSVFENSHIGISVVRTNGSLIQANIALAKMYGYDDPEIMKSEVTDIKKLYSNLSQRDDIIRILHLEGFIDNIEVEMVRRDGSRLFVLLSLREVRDEKGILLYRHGTHFDLTELKKIEQNFRDVSLYNRSLIEASLDPLVTINNNGTITDVNLATEMITGINSKKLIGSDFSNYFTEPDRAKEGYKTVFITGKVKDYPLTILQSGGRKIDVLYNASVYRNEAGEVQGVFAAARDITNSKKMEDELRKSRQLLRKLNQHLLDVRENERNEIGLSLHDDLGQRLTGLYLDTEWLKSRIGVQSAQVALKFDEMILMIQETIDNIKKISAILRPSILFELGLIPALSSYIKKFEEQSGIKCRFTSMPDKIVINDQISLILYRIILESFTNIARHSEASSASVRLRILNDNIELIIKDNGIGISKDKVSSLKSMGLEGMRERINGVGGRFQIGSKRGSGTTIKILIPLMIKQAND